MKGTVEVRNIRAQALVGNPLGDATTRATPIYLPPGYGEQATRYPVIYFLHGFTGRGLSWLNSSAFSLNVPQRMDRLISSEVVPPFIGVFVDGWTAMGGSQWLNSEAIGNYRDYLVRDVVSWVDSELRSIPRAAARAVVGMSSGGYGAWGVGANDPSTFSFIGCHSADAYFEYCYLPDFPKAAAAFLKAGGHEAWFGDMLRRVSETRMKGEDHSVINVLAMAAAYSPKPGAPLGVELPFEPQTGRIRPEVWSRWLEKDPVRFVPARLPAFQQLKGIFVDCGARDEFHLQWGTRMVVEALRQGGVQVQHEEFEDGHMGINYRYDRSVSYLAPLLDRA